MGGYANVFMTEEYTIVQEQPDSTWWEMIWSAKIHLTSCLLGMQERISGIFIFQSIVKHVIIVILQIPDIFLFPEHRSMGKVKDQITLL